MNVLVVDDYQRATATLACAARLAPHRLVVLGDLAREPAAAAALADAEALVLIRERTQVDAAFLRRTPRLRVVSQTGKVARNVDVAACSAAGVAVVEGTGSPVAPAELAWLLMMAARRRFVDGVNGLYRGQWQTTLGMAMHGARLGILGYGRIGKRVAGYGRAFGMRVEVWGSERARAEARADGLEAATARDAFFAGNDIVSVHLRLVPATEGSIGAADLARMQPDALFVNTSRAELVAPGVLEAALRTGRPGAAALDVFAVEPIYDPDHELLRMPNVLCSPHLGYVERASYELYLGAAFDNVLRFAAGDRSHVINP
ncbi:MAG TPA: D-2-hydroxyacid dehydrogenase family protein [Burkholderiaceae bacterium]|nr:D-2-hydroxyacid dehydrogenase family protein [Burkholderiaceae bacterium]